MVVGRLGQLVLRLALPDIVGVIEDVTAAGDRLAVAGAQIVLQVGREGQGLAVDVARRRRADRADEVVDAGVSGGQGAVEGQALGGAPGGVDFEAARRDLAGIDQAGHRHAAGQVGKIGLVVVELGVERRQVEAQVVIEQARLQAQFDGVGGFGLEHDRVARGAAADRQIGQHVEEDIVGRALIAAATGSGTR